MIEYISVSDVSRVYKDIANVYTGSFTEEFESIKEQAKVDCNILFRNRGLGITKILRKTAVSVDTITPTNNQFYILIETGDSSTILDIDYYFAEDDDTPTHTVSKTIDANTKTNLLLDAENYFSITSNVDVTLYKIGDTIFNIYYSKILANICDSGSLSTNAEDDIWTKRAYDLNARIDILVNSVIVYDADGDGEVTEEDAEQDNVLTNCKIKR